MTSGAEDNLWRVSAGARIGAPPLAADVSADLVIIGGGFTGCSAALEAARRGASVVLLEARDIGYGGSGRNVGLVNAGLWLPPEKIIALMGDAAGRRLIGALADGPDTVFDIIAREGISCEAARAGTLHLAHAPSGLADLQDRQRQGNAFGAALQLLDAHETRDRTGSDAFHGALLNPRAGTIQPLAYAIGLARAAIRAGATIHEHTRAEAVTQEAGAWVVRTAAGRVRADRLLMAMNAYDDGADMPVRPQYVPVHYSQFATAPLPADILATVLPGKEGCWDTALVMTSIRVDAAGRLIIGGMGDARGAAAGIHARWARRKLGALYPALADVAFDHAWSGRIAMTGDHIPKVVTCGPTACSVFGYSGRGIAPGTLFGRAAARALLSGDHGHFPVPVTDRHAESFTRLKMAFYELGATLAHAVI